VRKRITDDAQTPRTGHRRVLTHDPDGRRMRLDDLTPELVAQLELEGQRRTGWPAEPGSRRWSSGPGRPNVVLPPLEVS